jgi:hypothetical protein
MLRSLAKSILPAYALNAARQFRDDRALTAALLPIRDGDYSYAAVAALRRAWGNGGFSPDVCYLEECAARLAKCRGTVLECGTGASTLLAGVFAERNQFDLICFEQSPEWSNKVRRSLYRERLRRVTVLDVPLTQRDDYVWYAVEGTRTPHEYELVICDGPYVDRSLGEPVYSSWRYGLIPYLRQRKCGTLLLDDLDDPRAKAVIDRWAREFGTQIERVKTPDGDIGTIGPSWQL